MNLSTALKVINVITTADGAAGSTAINGAVVDAKGFPSVLFVLALGPIVSGAATSAKVEMADVSAMTSAVDIAGSSITIADDDDNQLKYIEIHKPTKRYLRLVVSRATQNATIGSAVAICGPADDQPVTQASGVEGELHVSPVGGTA